MYGINPLRVTNTLKYSNVFTIVCMCYPSVVKGCVIGEYKKKK